MAKACRPCGTMYGCSVRKATKWRQDVAMGVSPWTKNQSRAMSLEETAGTVAKPIPVARSGLCDRFLLTPMANASRPCGTTFGRRVKIASTCRSDE